MNRFSRVLSLFLLAVSLRSGSLWAMAGRPANPDAPPPPAWVQWFPIVFMIIVFYFLLIRPQSKQRKERELMMNALKKGDRIATTGGLIATVVNVAPDVVEVKLNEETKVKIRRSAVTEILTPEAEAAGASK